MNGSYDPWLVALSMLVAVLSSFVTFDVAARVTASRGPTAWIWLVGGALSMGTGIWSMHFIAMLAFRLPMQMHYDIAITIASLLITVVASGVALYSVSRESLGALRLSTAGLLMGLGIAGMHYAGMAAMEMSPPVRYQPGLFVLSIVVAVAVSCVALWLAFRLRAETLLNAIWRKAGSAVVMGVAICGMHYTGMAAAIFPVQVVGVGGLDTIDPRQLALVIGVFTFGLLAAILMISYTEVRSTRTFLAMRDEVGTRRLAIRRLGAQTAAAAVLVEAQSEEDAAPKLLEAIGRTLEWAVGALWMMDSSGDGLHCMEVWHKNEVRAKEFAEYSCSLHFQRGEGLPGRVWSSAKPAWIPDIAVDPNFPRAMRAQSAGLQSAFCFPIVGSGDVLGVIEFFSCEVEPPETELLRMMQTVGRLYGQFVERMHAEAALAREKLALEESRRDLTEAQTIARIGSWSWRVTGESVEWSDELNRMYGVEKDWHATVAGFIALVHPDDQARVQGIISDALASGEPFEYEHRILRPDGVVRHMLARGRCVFDTEGKLVRMLGTSQDITERKQNEAALEQLAHFDVLTGLPNRRQFKAALKNATTVADARGWSILLLFLDLDNFKDINDSLGHSVGDELLRHVARRLLDAVRLRDTVSRLGGDEFGIVMVVPDEAQIAERVAAKILTALRRPFEIEGHTVNASASIGITTYPDDAADLHNLVRFADLAMYEAKQAGRDSYRFYTEALNVRARDKLALESALRLALSNNEFELHYQPKICLRSGRWTGVEALLRWHRPGHGRVLPGEFIPVLEDTGLIVPVGAWVVTQACRQLRAWQDAGIGPLPIAVNVAAKQIARKQPGIQGAEHDEADGSGSNKGASDLLVSTSDCLHEHRIPSNTLQFELTESTIMEDAEHCIAVLQRLRALGIQIAVDDFGTGYSSLAYLRRLPLQAVKIDGSFIRDISTNADDASITLAIIGMAHRLKLRVIAEGVETAEQLRMLRMHGCDEAQGYYIARPMPAADLEKLWHETGGIAPTWDA